MYLGIDLGSRTIKVCFLSEKGEISFEVVESGYDPLKQALGLIQKYTAKLIVATGYGRHLLKEHLSCEVITEIKAHAFGVRQFFPEARTIIDIGGQDSKVISLDKEGRVARFLMNEKCAAGTGRFLEIMAMSLGYKVSEFGEKALQGLGEIKISSMCTVFAESEVISLKNRGANPLEIARAVHQSVVDKILSMVHRVGVEEKVVFTGGVAKNVAIARLLQEALGLEILIPPHPEITGALGCALYKREQT
ncbi:MAG: acyl-CoA dehydratase activase [Caldimicrobium sp.]